MMEFSENLRRMQGLTLKTLAQGRSFRVLRVEGRAVDIEVQSTRDIRRLSCSEIEQAWSELTRHGALTRGDVGGWNSAYIVAVLSRFPGVVTETHPIRLRYRTIA